MRNIERHAAGAGGVVCRTSYHRVDDTRGVAHTTTRAQTDAARAQVNRKIPFTAACARTSIDDIIDYAVAPRHEAYVCV